MSKLPVVHINGKDWFVDRRLGQLRNVENPHEWLNFNCVENLEEYIEQNGGEYVPAKQIEPKERIALILEKTQMTMLTFGGKQVWDQEPGDFHYGSVLTTNPAYTVFQNGLNYYVVATSAISM